MAFVAILASTAGIIFYLKDRIFQFRDYIENEPEHYDLFRELFERYGCENKQEFLAFLADHSHFEWGWAMVNGKFQRTLISVYDSQVEAAGKEFDFLMMNIPKYLVEDPLYYLELDPVILGIAIAVPTVLFIVWIVFHRRFDKAWKARRAQQAAVQNGPQF